MKKYVLFCRYCRYCVIYWKHHGFSFKTGGFLVTHRSRIRESRKNKNEKEKYAKEHFMCQVLRQHGFQVEHYQDNKIDGSYDIKIDGIKADLKCMEGYSNIFKRGLHAIRKQNADIVIFQFKTFNNYYKKEINNLVAKNIHGYYYIIGKENDLIQF